MPTLNVELDPELTELDDIQVTRIDQVGSPASGIPVLFMKSLDGEVVKDNPGCGCCADCSMDMSKDVNAQGGINETPDVTGAEDILQSLARLIQSEAREMAVGAWDEVYDIQLLTEVASIMSCFRDREMWGNEDDGEVQKALDDFAKEVYEDFIKGHRKFSASQRRSLASEGKALSDGSYPIPDADALRRAAILARSGHGDVAAAKRLIAKRAKELGVANPLAEKAEKSVVTQPEGYGTTDPTDPTKGSSLNPETDDGDDEPEGKNPDGSAVPDVVLKAAIVEATTPLMERIEALDAELAKMKALPAPIGVAVTAPPAARKAQRREELLAKAAHADRLAEIVTEQDLRTYYRAEAEQARADAAAIN